MPIRTYLLLIVLISTLGGVALTSIQLQRNAERLHAEAEIRHAEIFVTSLRPLEDSLRQFFSNFDLYIGSGQFFMEGGIKEGLALFDGFFAEVERMAPTAEQQEAVRVLARDMAGFAKFIAAVKEHGRDLPNDVLNEFDRESQKPVDDFMRLHGLAEAHLTATVSAAAQLRQTSRTSFVVSVLCFVLISILLLRWALRSIARPVTRLALSAEAAVEHGSHFQATQAGATEINRLSDSIGHLTNSLEALVLKRTDELHRKNHELNAEVARRAETENRLRVAKTAAEAASAAKSDFLAVMSHELRTPLNSILGFSDVLREGIQGELNEDQQKSVDNISTSGKHLLSLINDILDLSKIEAGKETLNLESLEVEPLCEDVVTLLGSRAEKRSIRIERWVCDEVAHVTGDRRRVRQILFNLLSNAMKFSREGGRVGLEVGLRSKADGTDGMVEFVVWDEGIGISKENQKKLFEPFVQVDSRLVRNHEGTGLGLSLVKRLVRLHGGQVEVESEEGEGSRFIVLLPWSKTATGRASTESVRDETVKRSLARAPDRRPLVLLVEDNELNQQSITTYLEANRFEVLVADNGESALRLAETQEFDLVLTDVQMPDMDGLELTRELRRREATRDVPLIALTAQAMNDDRERCLNAGTNDYLAKPLDLARLVELANKFTGRGV